MKLQINAINRSRRTQIAATTLLIIAVAGFFGWHYWQTHKPASYDVVVVGAGPSGVAATIQAARMGEHVALLEETDWIGGQMTAAGVGTMDEDSLATRNSGLYKEFVDHVNNYYRTKGKDVNTCYYTQASLCIDPQIGQTILKQMLNEQARNIQIFTRTKVSAVSKQDNVVTGVVANDRHLSSKVVIDATEYGDVIALAGAPYRLGNGTSSNPNQKACVQDITYAPVIKYYPNGVPPELQFKQPPPGYTDTIKKAFEHFLTEDGYSRYTSLKDPMSFFSYVAYRGLPDLSNASNYDVFQKDGHPITRTSLNLGNDFPQKGKLSTKYISNPTYRATSTCEAKLLSLQLMYYIQHDLGESHWSIANDEGYNTTYNQQNHCSSLNGYEAFEDQMPQEPYVREGRRLIGETTLTGQFLSERPWRSNAQVPQYSDSIAVGYYPMDLHGCNTSSTLEHDLDSASYISPNPASGPFEVPMGVLIPQSTDGLLAAEKNISVSRLAEGAIRLQPIAMDIGQASGALAALAAQQHVQPRIVAAQDVQKALIAAQVAIKYPSPTKQ